MKKIIHPFTLGAICISWTAYAIYISATTNEWLWFARSGTLWVLCGAALTVRSLLILGPDEYHADSNTIDGGTVSISPEVEAKNKESRLNTTSLHIGSWLVIIGTFTCGYGDLIERIIGE